MAPLTSKFSGNLKKVVAGIRRLNLDSLRWRVFDAKGQKSNPNKKRRQGKYPPTPEEVGLVLRALGYGATRIYIALGEVYDRQGTLAPLKSLFPNLHSKDTIARQEDLTPPYADTPLTWLRWTSLCVTRATSSSPTTTEILPGFALKEGDTLATNQQLIHPNVKRPYQLLLNRGIMTWEDFATGVRTQQTDFMGEPNETKLRRGEFHGNPSACICQSPMIQTQLLDLQTHGKPSDNVETHNDDYHAEWRRRAR